MLIENLANLYPKYGLDIFELPAKNIRFIKGMTKNKFVRGRYRFFLHTKNILNKTLKNINVILPISTSTNIVCDRMRQSICVCICFVSFSHMRYLSTRHVIHLWLDIFLPKDSFLLLLIYYLTPIGVFKNLKLVIWW